MNNNITFKDGVYGYRSCIVAYHEDTVIDYIFESTINGNMKIFYTAGDEPFTTSHKTFGTIEEAKRYVIEKCNIK